MDGTRGMVSADEEGGARWQSQMCLRNMFPLIKADMNIVRTFCRIGLIEGDCSKKPFKPTKKMEDDSKRIARKMGAAAGVPVSRVDLLVALGMESGKEVCGTDPKCDRSEPPCEIEKSCRCWRVQHPTW